MAAIRCGNMFWPLRGVMVSRRKKIISAAAILGALVTCAGLSTAPTAAAFPPFDEEELVVSSAYREMYVGGTFFRSVVRKAITESAAAGLVPMAELQTLWVSRNGGQAARQALYRHEGWDSGRRTDGGRNFLYAQVPETTYNTIDLLLPAGSCSLSAEVSKERDKQVDAGVKLTNVLNEWSRSEEGTWLSFKASGEIPADSWIRLQCISAETPLKIKNLSLTRDGKWVY
ncbi:hypothetical protein [Streptomyces wuyuanensis]|uniref:hypothetical protein n=1 Tax=Streptomyces wuyuanensis TaxID=1196353 RepID=UPI00344531B0